MAAAFDLRRLALTSEAIPVLDGILPSQFTGAARYSFSTTGSLVYDGRELFYREGSKMMAVDVTTEPAFSAGKPKMLFDGPYLMTGAQYPNYDVAPDGKRFLMLKPVEEAQAAAQINVVLNWFSELQQRVPVK